MTDSSQGVMSHPFSDVSMEMETPKMSQHPDQTTPRRSERKRALFPTASPQTSDLGHMSPLGSSPDRFGGPASPDSTTYSPVKKASGPASPFGRRVASTRVLYKASPRKQFSELFGLGLNEKQNNLAKNGQMSPSVTKQNARNAQQSIRSLEKQNEIVPVDQLEQTVLSVMEESDCPESPHSEHTPGTTPHRMELFRSISEVKSAQPLTPSKRRSMPASGSGSTTSASPHSPDHPRRFSLASRSAELPRARTSLFSGNNRTSGVKRERDDGIYLTGGGNKRRKTYGEINGGVRTGIRRPPKVKPKTKTSSKKKQGKVKSIWDVAPKSSSKKKSVSPIKLPKMSLLANPVKRSDVEVASFSASASLQVRARRSLKSDDKSSNETEEEEEMEASPEPDPTKRYFKTGKSRVATLTINNVRMKLHKGKFTVEKSPPPPPAKRRRKLYSRDKQMEAIKVFEDNEEDVAESTRCDVQNILQKLEEEKCDSPNGTSASNPPADSSNAASKPKVPTADSIPASLMGSETDAAIPNSPPRHTASPSGSTGFLSPLSQLASSTSTLSIDVGGDTLYLNKAQVQALSQVPDVIMEEDDISLCEALPDEADSNVPEEQASQRNEMKENEGLPTASEATPTKYFPIFTGNSKVPMVCDSAVTERKRKRSLLRPIGNDQYQLDAGQKRFGATECGTCGAIYQMGEPEDEIAHQEFHDAVKDLKFVGWKQERVIGEYGRGDRVIVIRPGDPKAWWSKALDVLNVVDKDLGFAEGVHCDPDHSMVYMFISDKCVVGCLLAVPVKVAHRMIMTDANISDIDCCSAEEYPVRCGVSRIWVHGSKRRQNIASQLMDCMRKNFIFGHVLSMDELSFSSPSLMGKMFAEHYTGQKDYLVYTQS